MANSREFNPNHPIPLCVIDATQQTELATRRSHPFDETYYTLSIMRARPAERAEECTNRSSVRGGRCYHRTVLDRCFLADAHDSKKVTLGQTTTPPIGFHRKKHAVYLSTDGLGDGTAAPGAWPSACFRPLARALPGRNIIIAAGSVVFEP